MANINFNWRFCDLCFAVFWSKVPGKCPATSGRGHRAQGFEFILQNTPGPRQQADWQHCSKCSVLYYNGFPDNGTCIATIKELEAHQPIDDADGPIFVGHVPNGPNIQVWHDVDLNSAGVLAQNAWRFCRKCYVLHYAGFANKGVCPTGGAHDGNGSFDYLLEH